MTSPRCETCPWWRNSLGRIRLKPSCRHHLSKETDTPANWWCSLHPDAPKPVYEHGETALSEVPPDAEILFKTSESPDGFRQWFLWRRITGYTGGGDD